MDSIVSQPCEVSPLRCDGAVGILRRMSVWVAAVYGNPESGFHGSFAARRDNRFPTIGRGDWDGQWQDHRCDGPGILVASDVGGLNRCLISLSVIYLSCRCQLVRANIIDRGQVWTLWVSRLVLTGVVPLNCPM